MGNPTLVNVGKGLTSFALAIRFPIKPFIKPTIFKHFCGGESIDECDETIAELGNFNIGTILDYSVEGIESEADFDANTKELIATILKGRGNKHIPFSVFKVTGIARFALLEKINAKTELTADEQAEFARVEKRINTICKAAFETNTPVLIDAEESWIQDCIDDLADEMMRRYNKQKAVVYNTLQMYRWDRLEFLKKSHAKAQAEGYILGVKVVRGAYMEKERDRAEKMGYKSPIQPDKAASDRDYNLAMDYCVERINEIWLVAGTHNEESSMHVAKLMQKHNIEATDPKVYFAQLYGMSDHISYNLSNAGYNVAKYVPYGPVKEVIPYLIRRAQENTSAAGQTSRELKLIIQEKQRRKQAKR